MYRIPWQEMSAPMALGIRQQTKAKMATSLKLPRLLVSLVLLPLPGLVTGMARALVPCVGGFGPLINSPNLSRLVSRIFSESISQCFPPSLHSEILGLTLACCGVTSALSGSPTPTVGKSLATHRDPSRKPGVRMRQHRPNFDQQVALPVRRQLVSSSHHNPI